MPYSELLKVAHRLHRWGTGNEYGSWEISVTTQWFSARAAFTKAPSGYFLNSSFTPHH